MLECFCQTQLCLISDGLQKIFEVDESNMDGLSNNDQSENEWHPYSQKQKDTLKDLRSYKDFLVNDILAVWDVANDGSECADNSAESIKEPENRGDTNDSFLEIEPVDKVNLWLRTYSDNNPEPLDKSIEIAHNETTQPDTCSFEESVIEMSSTQDLPVKAVSKSAVTMSSQGSKKPPKKSKKYVKGF